MSAAPNCRWCGKKLRPVYEFHCKDCGHRQGLHRMTNTAAQAHCRGDESETCPCTVVDMYFGFAPATLAERRSVTIKQFPRVLMGYGKCAQNLFCTFWCALSWAHKYAPLTEKK